MDRTIKTSELLSAAEAVALLQVKPATLYAYVSRGLVRSVGEGGRTRRYVREDLERLKARHDARAGHAAVAAAAMRWGEPVLDTSISRITPEGPLYREQAALELARSGASFEAVAELLLTGTRAEEASGFVPAVPGGFERLLPVLPPALPPIDALLALLPLVAVRDTHRKGAGGQAELARARGLLALLPVLLAAAGSRRGWRKALEAGTVASALLCAFGVRPARERREAIDSALILCADHELNPSTFAARVTASAGADLYACVQSALATLSGSHHGGLCERVEALVLETAKPERARQLVSERARRGDPIPGFGHPLYPEGDPRAELLIELAQKLAPRDPTVRTVVALERAVVGLGRERATLDTGLVALCAAAGLPRGAALALFAVGRSAGWLAHALEQREAGYVLRPRARYVARSR